MNKVLIELSQAEKELTGTMEMVESTAIGFGAAIQVFEREMQTALAHDPESLALLATTCRTLLELPKLTIGYTRQANESFASVANTVRKLFDTIEQLTQRKS